MTTENTTVEQPTETALTLKHAMLSTVFKKTEATKFIELIDEEVMKEVCDPTTTKGQERERSLAAGISSFKAHMNRLALASIEKHAEIVKSTKLYLKEFNANCDTRRDERKAPTLKHEAGEKERKDGHRAKIAQMRELADRGIHAGLAILVDLIEKVKSIATSLLDEFEAEGDLVKAESLKTLNAYLVSAKEREAQAAELKRLQKEAEKRKVEDAEREAKEEELRTEAARVEAETIEAENAKKQRLIEEEKGIEEIRQLSSDDQSLSEIMESLEELENFDMTYFIEKAERAEEIRGTAISFLTRLLESARQAAIEENKAIEAAQIEQKRLDDIAAKEKADKDAKAAEETEKQRQIEEDERIEQAKADARQEEIERFEKQQILVDAEVKRVKDKAETDRIAKENAELKRQADKDHRALILGEVFDAIRKTKDHSELLDLMEHGQIPHVTINF